MKRPSVWLIPLGLWVFVSAMATSLGVMRLLDVQNEIRGTAERARLALDAGETAVVSFVPGSEGTVTVGHTGKAASTENAIALLTFLYCASLTLVTHFAAERLRANPRASAWLNRIAGSMLLAFGLKLAIQK